MKLLSRELVSLEYREQLQRDLAKASICRFLVAYISGEGIESIGRHLLTRGLRDGRSFGVGSLSCSCGYEPLLKLQAEMPELRLKYFMDPLVKEEGEPSEISLFHSKLVYLYLEREAKSVVYIGSHNWTRRALGPQGPRNAEASIRFESDFVPEDIDGSGASVASHVNRHLLDAWNMPLCLPAAIENKRTFEEWFNKGCRKADPSQLQETTILLAVRKQSTESAQWQALKNRGIYLQVLDESEGQKLWRSRDGLLVLVWETKEDLSSGRQPIILQCRVSTRKAGPTSTLRGTNQSDEAIKGFVGVLFDEAALAVQMGKPSRLPTPVRIWSGVQVNVYEFENPAKYSDCAQVDAGVQPNYQFYLEVEHVVYPADNIASEMPECVWPRETFAITARKKEARLEETPGYFVEPERQRQMLDCLRNVLMVDPDEAKVLPYSDFDRLKVGKLVSRHPLHDTFIGPEWKDKQRRDEYYERSEPGALVAELDEEIVQSSRGRNSDDEPRVQRVFTAKIGQLLEVWKETARLIRNRREGT